MTHPIDRPRGDSGLAFGEQPAPIHHAPVGGCMGTKPPKRVHATCHTCPRLGVGGRQIRPNYVISGPRLDCDDFVHGDLHVAAIPAAGLPPSSGSRPPTAGGPSHAPLQPGVSQARSLRHLGDDT